MNTHVEPDCGHPLCGHCTSCLALAGELTVALDDVEAAIARRKAATQEREAAA